MLLQQQQEEASAQAAVVAANTALQAAQVSKLWDAEPDSHQNCCTLLSSPEPPSCSPILFALFTTTLVTP